MYAELLKQKRGARSLRAVAAETGISIATLSRIERGGTPTLEHAQVLDAWLEVKPNKTEIPRHIVASIKARIQTIETELEALKRLIADL